MARELARLGTWCSLICTDVAISSKCRQCLCLLFATCFAIARHSQHQTLQGITALLCPLPWQLLPRAAIWSHLLAHTCEGCHPRASRPSCCPQGGMHRHGHCTLASAKLPPLSPLSPVAACALDDSLSPAEPGWSHTGPATAERVGRLMLSVRSWPLSTSPQPQQGLRTLHSACSCWLFLAALLFMCIPATGPYQNY